MEIPSLDMKSGANFIIIACVVYLLLSNAILAFCG